MTNIRKTFHQELEDLQRSIVEMGALAEEQIKGAVKALVDRDAELAVRVIRGDAEINQREQAIESHCLKLLALQQPMASDLKIISASFKIVTDIERLADHAVKIAKKSKILSGRPQLKPYVDLPKMTDTVVDMLRKSLDAFIRRDAALAEQTIGMDDAIDQYNYKIFKELVEFMNRDSSCVDTASHLLFVTQSLERIADYVTNICERAIFLATGKLPPIEQKNGANWTEKGGAE